MILSFELCIWAVVWVVKNLKSPNVRYFLDFLRKTLKIQILGSQSQQKIVPFSLISCVTAML